MENFNWFSFVLYIVGVWFVFKLMLALLQRRNLEDDDDEMAEPDKVSSTKDSEVIVVNIEKHGDIYYLFERDTDSFVGQGRTEEELKEVVTKRFPGKRFMASEDDLIKMGLNF